MKVSKSGVFLFELIVVIFLFTICSAVCISIFAKSYSFSTDSKDLTMASIKTESVAEIFKTTDGDPEKIAKSLKMNDSSHDIIQTKGNLGEDLYTMNIYYDKDWKGSDKQHKVYTMTVTKDTTALTKNGHILDGDIKVTSGKDTIFQIDVQKYLKNEERSRE